ncbi:MAG TPA: cytochrome P450 [Acidimicrobiales bacterium]|nr:cytochrome P450 [Acidimicrobiales bacterium]
MVTDSVTDLADPVMFADPFPRYASLRQREAVSPAYSKQLMGGAGFMLTRHEHVLLLHNDVRFSSDPTSGESGFMIRHMPRMFRLLTSSMVYKDDPDHARLRRLVNKAFTPRMVQQMTDDIERIVGDLVDELGRRGGETVDLVAEFATPLPLSVISTMLGVGDEDRDEFHVLMERFVARLGSGSGLDAVRTIPTARRLYTVLQRLAEARRASPDEGLISGLLAANEDGDSLNDEEVIAMIFLLMLAGHDTTANLIGSSAVALMEHPEQAARWRDEPELTTSAVEELLRFTTPVPCGAARTLLDDVSIEGTTMPKGSKVMGMIISANRDEAVFDQPDALDLGRDPNRHLTFAFGKHFCLGNQLARLEGQIAIGALVRRFPAMRLAVPRDRLEYKSVQSLRGFQTLPVTLQ